MEVSAELGAELCGEVGVGDLVDGTDDFFGVPRRPDLPAGITGLEQPVQSLVASVVEAFVCLGQQAAGPIQRVVLAAPMPQGLVLDPTAALIELRVGGC